VPWVSKSAKRSPWLSGIRALPAGLSHRPLFFITLALSFFGLLMIYSSSAILGMQKYGDAFYFVKRQGAFLAIGWGLYFVVAQLSLIRISRYRLFFLLPSLALLLMVLFPGLGVSAGGARRWINIGFTKFQPSELVRFFLVMYLAGTLAFRKERLASFNRGFLPLLIVTSVLMFLLIAQPDFGGAMSILIISLAMWFIGGVPLSYLGGLCILSVPAVIFILFQAQYRAQRVMTFLHPWKEPQGAGFQIIQSFLAFYEGGWTGVGLGNSTQKLFYLPEAHTDFIFSVIGEELGVLGLIAVVALFVGLLVCGAKIARSQASSVGYFLATGLTVFFCLPALFNMMVTLGMLPTKGLPLPFFSYGGSSMVVSMIALGALQALYRRRDEEDYL